MNKPTALLLAGLLCAAAALTGADINIPIEKYKLSNGMRVILSQDNSLPVVAVYVIYDVGARAEEKGRTGFAHLFEHMMFQGSANAPKGVHFKQVEANGGTLNGSTHPDFTDYYESLPSNKLGVGLWLEADRMRSLAINDANLTNQKEAVKQERRLRVDNQPYSTAMVEKWPLVAFQNWSSSHSIIGAFEDLNAATVEDVAKFFKTYYAPNNAVLVVVGDIQIPATKKMVEQYFADIPAQPQPPRPDLTEPPMTAPRRDVHKDPLARVPGVIIGYPGPERRSKDYYAIGMLDALFTGGDSSRFQLNLVKGKQSVVQAEANLGWPYSSANDYRAPGLYGMFFLHNPNFTGRQIVTQVEEEIGKIQKEGVPAAELERARTFVRANRIKELQGVMTRARLLGQFEVFDGKPELISTELNDYMAVTAADIQAAARKYLVPEKQVVLEIQPAPKEPAAKKETQ